MTLTLAEQIEDARRDLMIAQDTVDYQAQVIVHLRSKRRAVDSAWVEFDRLVQVRDDLAAQLKALNARRKAPLPP